MLMGATEARWSQRMGRLRIPSIKLQRKGLWDRYRPRRVARVLLRRARTAVLPRGKRQMATSMRPPTVMSTRTPGAVGRKPRVRNPAQVTRALLVDTEGRKRAAGHLPLAEAVGNPSRRVLVVRQAAVVVAAVAAGAGEPVVFNQPVDRGLRKYWRM